MIPQSYITAWRKHAPWQENYQVEQDLIIQQSLIALFSDEFISERLAFRGGTALHKLFFAAYPGKAGIRMESWRSFCADVSIG